MHHRYSQYITLLVIFAVTHPIFLFLTCSVLLGVIDPQEQQSFYKNIGSTGQRGSIHAGGEECNDRLPIEEEGMAARGELFLMGGMPFLMIISGENPKLFFVWVGSISGPLPSTSGVNHYICTF